MTSIPTLRPAWPAPSRVRALFTTRAGGVSSGPWGGAAGAGGLNLGTNCGDDPAHVARNRQLLAREVGMPIHWLGQVHGARVVEVVTVPRLGEDGSAAASLTADAQVTCVAGVALGILVADCLPVLIADRAGTVVGAAHAGWRGLAAGVLENTVATMRRHSPDADLVAWLGPCIGPQAFEVGDDVLQAFTAQDPKAAAHFARGAREGKWWADLAGLGARRLRLRGVATIVHADACTVADPGRFWSYRRDGACGRMAGIIGLRD